MHLFLLWTCLSEPVLDVSHFGISHAERIESRPHRRVNRFFSHRFRIAIGKMAAVVDVPFLAFADKGSIHSFRT